MKTAIAKISLIICLFTVFSCTKPNKTSNNGPTNNHQATTCQIATLKGSIGDFFFYYNAKKQLIAYSQYDSTGKNGVDSTFFQYNNAGQLILAFIYNIGSTVPNNFDSFVYNKSGYLIQNNQFIGLNLNGYDNYTLDSKGNIITDSTYSFTTGSPVYQGVQNFAYDGNGNITDWKSAGVISSHFSFAYDNETSCENNLPLAFRILFNNGGSASTPSNYNNVSSVTAYSGTVSGVFITNTYTYNSEGLPVTETSTVPSLSVQHTTFTYTNCN